MFERISLRTQQLAGRRSPLDLGLLAESLLFYGKVHLIANRAVLEQLLQLLGPELTVRLAEQEYIELDYCNQFSGVHTENAGTASARHNFTVVEMPHTAVDRLAPEAFIETTGRPGRGRRLAARFLRHVERVRLDDRIARHALEDAADADYVDALVRNVLSTLAPSYRLPDDFQFDVEDADENGIAIHTNLDFAQATEAFQHGIDTDVRLSPEQLLTFIVAVHEELAFAGLFGAEIATSRLASSLITLRFRSLLDQHSDSEARLGAFQEFVFSDGRAVAEAVRSGRVSFLDVLEVVERSRKFHEWLAGKPADVDLVREYFRDCTASTWVDRLPAKTMRWLLVTGASTAAGIAAAGPLGIGAGLVIGAADFVTDLRRPGWAPNQFIEGDLRKMLS